MFKYWSKEEKEDFLIPLALFAIAAITFVGLAIATKI